MYAGQPRHAAKRIVMAASRLLGAAAAVISLLKFLLKSASKSSFFRFGVEIHSVLALQFPTPLRIVLLCFAIQYLEIAL